MDILNSFNIDIQNINIAHEFIINKDKKCEYLGGREHYGIVYCLDGEAEYVFSSKKHITISAGEVLLLKPDASYSISVNGNTEFKHYTVNFDVHKEFSDVDFMSDVYYLISCDNSELYRHKFKKLITLWSSKAFGYKMQAVACLYDLLSLLISEMFEKEYNINSRFRLQPAQKYIEENFASSICLNVLANLSNMSVTNFRREWKKIYGITPIQYRDILRLNHAKEYLMVGYYSVSEVSKKCGFEDTNYFIRFFKKHEGISPGRFINVQ